MKISIVIPVYNTAKYLAQCVDSVLAQTAPDKEIILVNDGSTDDSPNICNAYAEKYDSVIAIHQSNGGLSAARNTGINAATGEVLFFLDSDDYWLKPDAAEEIAELMEAHDLDFVEFGAQKCNEAAEAFCTPDYLSRPGLETCLSLLQDKNALFTLLLKNNALISSACNKAVRRALLLESELYFRPGIISEDVDWCARLIEAANRTAVYNETVMAYRQRGGSITHTHTLAHIRQAVDNLFFIETHLKSPLISLYLSIAFSSVLLAASSLPWKQISVILPELSHFCPYLKEPSTSRVAYINKVYRLAGLRAVLCALKLALFIRGSQIK